MSLSIPSKFQVETINSINSLLRDRCEISGWDNKRKSVHSEQKIFLLC